MNLRGRRGREPRHRRGHAAEHTVTGRLIAAHAYDDLDAELPDTGILVDADHSDEPLGTVAVHVQTGVFGASMEVEIVNGGPVTILLE